MTLFEYAVIYEKETLLVKPECILAKDEAAVRFIVAQKLVKDGYDDPDVVEILVRPFV